MHRRTGSTRIMRRAPPGCQRPYSPAITGQLLVGSAVLMCAAGLGAHLLCGARPSGTSASLPVIAGELLASSAVLLCTAGPGAHLSCGMRPSGANAPICQQLLVICRWVLLCCCALQDWGRTHYVARAPRGPSPPFASHCWSIAGEFCCAAVHCRTGDTLVM